MSDFPPVVDMPDLGYLFEIIPGTEDIPKTEEHPPRRGLCRYWPGALGAIAQHWLERGIGTGILL